MRKIFCIFHFILILSACKNHNLSPPDTITTILNAPVLSLDPALATDANSQHVNELIHASLVKISDSLMPEPYLAESFRILNDRSIEFRLKKACHFHDGEELTVDSVIRSFDYYLNASRNSPFQEIFKKIERIEKIDPYRFRIHTRKAEPSLLANLYSLKIIGKNPSIGIGPFRLLSQSANEILLERAQSNCVPFPKIQKVKIKIVRDDLARYLKLRNGELDIIMNELNSRKIEAIEADPSSPLAVVSGNGTGFNYLAINMQEALLRDPRVRRALALSFDIDEINKYKNRNYATSARNLLSDFNWYANLKIPLVHRDLKEARRLLDLAGYYNGENKKKPLILSLKTSSNSNAVENATVLVAQAKEAGIILKHRAYEWGTFYSDVKSKNTQLYTLRWVGTTDPSIYFENFHSGEIERNNRTFYKNPVLDHWLEKGESTLNLEKRRQYYYKVQEIVAEDLPYINLWHNKNVAVFRKDIKDVRLFPTGSWETFFYLRKESP
jgi:peptide/nickel transport system substrate-binding protein